MRTTLFIVACLMLTVGLTQAQPLQEGAWTGTAINSEGQTFGLTYNVSHPDGVLSIMLEVLGVGAFPLNDIGLTDTKLTFAFDAGTEFLTCVLTQQDNGEFEGECMDEGGTPGQLTMKPPVSSDRPSLSGNVMQYVSVEAPVVALTNVKVIDGTGAPSKAGQTIVIDGMRIADVGPDGSVEIPEGAEVMDLAGHTVTPGFIGLHNHTFYMTSQRSIQLNYSAPRLYLASGVTTIRTTGSMAPYDEINLHKAIEEGEVPGPQMFITGPYLTGGSGVDGMSRLSGADDARRVVKYWAEEGVTWFKAYTEISRAELEAAIDEAHKHGLKVTAHLCSVSYREAVALGIDNLEHGFFTNTDYDPQKEPDQCPSGFRSRLADVDIQGDEVKATFDDMIANGVGMTSTLAVYELFVPNRPPLEQRVLDAMSPEVREEYLTTREQIANMGENAPFSEYLFKKALEYEYEFVKAGGLLAAGVDPTGNGGALPGYGDQRNYELLLEAGFTPVETIQIMSANGAKVLGIDDEVGTVTPGKLANLVVINGDIEANHAEIRNVTPGKLANLVVINGDIEANHAEIRNVTLVFRDGYGYDAARLVESIQGVVGVK